jgi:putative phosphoesterase
MRYALIGDVHANLPALETVLERLHSAGVDAIWNTGDWVGYHAFPDEVVCRLRSEQAISVIGNYDQKVLKFPQKECRWRHSKPSEKFIAFQWAFNNLSEENRSYLRQLPTEVRVNLAGVRLLMTHGSPAAISEHIDPGTPQSRLRALALEAAADVIILGHSHVPMDRQVGGTRFVNPGSVGRADDGDPRAAYAILEITNGKVSVHHFRIRYDIQRACQAIRENDLPKQFERMAIQGRSLDFVMNQTG